MFVFVILHCSFDKSYVSQYCQGNKRGEFNIERHSHVIMAKMVKYFNQRSSKAFLSLWNLLEEHLLHAVHEDITQLRGQHGPVQDWLLVLLGHALPPQEALVVTGLVRVLVPVLSHAALHDPHEPHLPTRQFTGQHLYPEKNTLDSFKREQLNYPYYSFTRYATKLLIHYLWGGGNQ